MRRADAAAVPRGWRGSLPWTAKAHATYQALTGRVCDAEVLTSPRMGARTAGLYRAEAGRHLIVLSERYLAQATLQQAEDLLRHELAHYHLAVTGNPRAGHGLLFRALMRAWSFSRFPDPDILHRIARASPRLRHLYLCPCGHEHWLARHPGRRAISCATCAPVYDRRFRLRYSGTSGRR